MRDYSNGPAPSYWQLFWKHGGVLPIILAVMTVIFTAISQSGLQTAARMEAEGEETLGRVTGREIEVTRRDGSTERKYYVSMAYVVDGEAFTARKKVSNRIYQARPEGSEHKVRYLRSAPKVVEFDIGSYAKQGSVLKWVSLALGLGTLAAGWFMGRSAVAMVRARRFGPEDRAKVVEVRKKKTKNSRGYVLIWRDSQGQEGQSLKSGSEARYSDYPPGTEITLFRDARGRGWWIGDVGPREHS